MTPGTQPECIYCGQAAEHCGELRLLNSEDVSWFDDEPMYVCRDCFTGSDTGPSFDDLPGVKS